jgi:hypothetical protein
MQYLIRTTYRTMNGDAIHGEVVDLSFLMVNLVLAKRGWFTPPFWTKMEIEAILREYYSEVEIDNVNSMVILHCVK